MLGGQLMKVFGSNAIGWDRGDVDASDNAQLSGKLKAINQKLKAIINCVAYNDVDGAQDNQSTSFLLNAEVPKNLSIICKELDVPLVHFSTNYVFDGLAGEYGEIAEPNPLSVYGQSKYQGEKDVMAVGGKYYIIRTSVLFGPKGQSELSKKSFVYLMLGLAEKDEAIKAVSNEVNSLTYAVDLAVQTKVLLEQELPYGIYHITNSGQASWYDFAKEIFSIKNIKVKLSSVPRSEFPRKAITPKKAVLLNTKLPPVRSWQEALTEFLTSKDNL